MEFRSSNTVGYAHFQGDIISNVSSAAVPVSSHGVQLTGGSSGGIVTAAGDEANISLRVLGKGAAQLILGSTAQVSVGSTNSTVFFSGSTTPFSGFIRFTDTAVATPSFATTNAMVMETTHVITGLRAEVLGDSSGYFVIANGQNLSTDCVLGYAYVGSTVTELHCRFIKVSTLTVAATTATINFLIIRM